MIHRTFRALRLPTLLFALGTWVAPEAQARQPGPKERLGKLESHLRGAPAQREAVLDLFRDHEPLLEFLPLDDLEDVRLPRAGVLELRFDFGRRSTKKVEIPGTERLVVDADERGEPKAGAKPRRVRSDSRELIVHRTVRLKYSGRDLTGVREGDLELSYGLFSPDIELRTETHPDKTATDEDGRVVVEMDEQGRPVRRNGGLVPVRADRWLVLEVRGRRVEVPLPTPAE